MDADAARTLLMALVDADCDPVLSEYEITTLMDLARLPDPFGNLPANVATASAWAASTGYLAGATVTASPAAGRWWVCVTPGTSDDTQPEWPDLSTQPRGSASVTDGSVVWLDAGSGWAPTWDLDYAAELGWQMKAGRAAGRFDFTTDGQTFRRGQVITHCQQMAASFRRKRAGSAPIR